MSSRGLPKTAIIRDRLQKEAEARQAEYDKLSIQEKLERLPPEPQAQRQRTKLLAQLEGKNAKPKKQIENQIVEENIEHKHLKVKERKAKEQKSQL